MKRFWWVSLYAATSLAWAEEPPAPQAEDEEREVIEVLTEEDLKREIPQITLKQLTPKETISLDQAVDMPSDI
ncbi:MAG: hypothetical protein OXG03_06655 [Gammaproteobacteria bacterium]|nr:hypothetical protein [Gammaproteobacteria bacterium]